MIKFYVLDNNQQKGPFSENELKSMLLTNDTFVWREGMENWDYAKNIEELKIYINSTPPPIPNFENLNSTININVKTHKSELDKKENHLKKERIKSKFAYELVYLIICIMILFLCTFVFPYDESEKYARNLNSFFGLDYYSTYSFDEDSIKTLYSFIAYTILLHRPVYYTFKWIIIYSKQNHNNGITKRN